MAAHCATLFHSLLLITDDAKFLERAKFAMSYASGIDNSIGFQFEYGHDYSALYDAVDPVAGKMPDVAKAKSIMQEMFDVMNPVLQHYASSEEFNRVKMNYWKPGTPWCHKRYAKFHTATGFMHQKAGTGAPYTVTGQERYKAIAEGRA